MVECKFYREGYCKFGSRCRYEHVDHGAHSSRSRELPPNERLQGGVSILKGGSPPSGYQQLNQTPTVQFSQTPETDFSQKITTGSIGLFNVQEVMAMITRDVMQVVAGGQWQLSCYGPARDLPNVPGLEDYSPEEIRWECYKALSSGTLPLWQTMAQQLSANVTKTYSDLQHQPHVYALVDGWLRKIESSPAPTQNIAHPFHGVASPSVPFFNKPPDQSSASSSFSFNLSEVKVDNTTQINSCVLSDKNFFATNPSSNSSMLNPLGSGIPSLPNDSQAYSKPEDLSDEDKEAFQADRFTIGKIPTRPPTVTFCNV